MKRILLPLSLLLLLALAAGCSAQGEAQLDPTMAQQLQIDETMAATLAPGIQDVDVTDRGTDLTIHVRQTLGNDRELYVLYDVTLAGTVALPAGEEGWFGPQTVTLQGVEESTASRGSVQSVFLDKEGQTITYLSYFSRDTAWPAGDLRLSVGDFVSDDASLTQEVAQVTWTPENQGTVLEGTVQNPAGEAVGSVTLTPFSLSYAFTEGAHLELEEINGMALPNAYLLDSQGMARRAGSASGGGGNWGTTFRTPLDLTTVSAVEVAGYVVPLGQGTAVPENWDAQATEQAAWDRVLFYFGLDPAEYTYFTYREDRWDLFTMEEVLGLLWTLQEGTAEGSQPVFYRDDGADLWYTLLRQGESYQLYTLQRNPNPPADPENVTQRWLQAQPVRTLPAAEIPAVEPMTHPAPEEALAQAVGPAAQPLDVAYGTGPIQWALVYTNPEEPGRACFLLQTGEGEHRPVTMGDEESGFVYLPDSLAVEGDTVTASFREGEGSDQVHDLSLQFTRPAEGEVRFTAGETLRTLPEEEA